MYDLIVRDADVLQFDGDTPVLLPRHSIAVSQGRIARIAPQTIQEPARETIPARGMLAIPGLINCHAHTAMSLFRGVAEDVPIEAWFNDYIWPMETNLTAEDVYWGALLGIAEMIEAGVTCVADHYFSIEAVARAVEETGLRAHLAPTIFGGPDEGERLAQAVLADRVHRCARRRDAGQVGRGDLRRGENLLWLHPDAEPGQLLDILFGRAAGVVGRQDVADSVLAEEPEERVQPRQRLVPLPEDAVHITDQIAAAG